MKRLWRRKGLLMALGGRARKCPAIEVQRNLRSETIVAVPGYPHAIAYFETSATVSRADRVASGAGPVTYCRSSCTASSVVPSGDARNSTGKPLAAIDVAGSDQMNDAVCASPGLDARSGSQTPWDH